MYIERLDDSDNPYAKEEEEKWAIIAVDGDMETQLRWNRTNILLGQSKVQIRWSIPLGTLEGIYRIRHVGKYKVILCGI